MQNSVPALICEFWYNSSSTNLPVGRIIVLICVREHQMKRKKRRRNAACAGGRGGKEMVLVARREVASATVKLRDSSLTAFVYQFYHIINRAMRSNSINQRKGKVQREKRGEGMGV